MSWPVDPLLLFALDGAYAQRDVEAIIREQEERMRTRKSKTPPDLIQQESAAGSSEATDVEVPEPTFSDTDVAPAAAREYITLPLAALCQSPTNPRRPAALARGMEELTASIKAHGIIQPLLVRPHTDSMTGRHPYQVVAGARRLLAAQAAGLKHVPCIVQELDDRQVLEIQLIENLQRQDLHPLEEAEGYRQLHETLGRSVDEIADQIGKSKAYVYARLKLTELPASAKEAFWSDQLSPSVALLIARIPDPKLAAQAAKQIQEHGGRTGEPMSYRVARDTIERDYMLALSGAPFPKDDAELYPQAGPCTSCPKRTGNQPELFADYLEGGKRSRGDVCTDPRCYQQKADLHWKATEAEASELGLKVLTPKQSAKAFPYGDRLNDSSYVDLAGHNYLDPKARSWKQLLGQKAKEHVVLARDPRGGVHELVPRQKAAALLKELGHKWAKRESKTSKEDQAWRRRQQQERERTKRRAAVGALLRQALHKAAVEHGPDTLPPRRHLLLIARTLVLYELAGWSEGDILTSLGLPEDPKAAARELETLKPGRLWAIVVAGSLQKALEEPGTGWKGVVTEACELYDVNLKALERQADATAAAEKPKEEKPRRARLAKSA